jgi:hypothetical protein
MLVALIDRIKGVAQALTSLSGSGEPLGHAGHLTVSDLYTWYVYRQQIRIFANSLQDKCFIPCTHLAQHLTCTKRHTPASDCFNDCSEVFGRSSSP